MLSPPEFRPYPRYLLRKRLIKQIINHHVLSKRRCLEIGFGEGDLLFYLASQFKTAYGYDVSPDAVSILGRRLQADSRNITLLSETELKLGFFDCVIACEVLEHIEDDVSALRHWRALMAAGGTLIISVPAHASRWCPNDDVSGHLRRYERAELVDKLRQAGFEVSEVWSYGYPLIVLLDFFLNRRAGAKLRDNWHGRPLEQITTEELTQRSFLGGQRRFDMLYCRNALLYPFYLLQMAFLKFDCSSAYLAWARNPGGPG
jgi:SAM-dependent methyltransferase